MTNPSTTFKIVVLGASAVGKSSIVQRLIQGTFTEEGTTTCGADFYSYSCPVETDSVRLQIWDTAGQERFRSISKSYFRNAVGAILVYDITSMASFEQLTDWLNDLQSLSLPNAYILLVGNKSDLESQREVGAHLVKEFCGRHHLDPVETSAANGKGVKEAFARLGLDVFNRVKSNQISPTVPARPVLQSGEAREGSGTKPCC
jgi:small GTP-binding protein